MLFIYDDNLEIIIEINNKKLKYSIVTYPPSAKVVRTLSVVSGVRSSCKKKKQ